MKRFVPLFLALVLLTLIPLASLAEANVALNPDDSWWGMSRTKFKETFGDVSFEEVTVDRHKALALRAVDIGSLTVDVYFDFAQREAGKSYYTLSKVAYIVPLETRKFSSNALSRTYNTLVVSAPEIRGLWDFTLFPGTVRDGKLDRSVHSQGLCCMMIATDDERVKRNSWEFMKWWVSAEAQVRFGREIESILGSSARYATANRDALSQLAWSADQLKVLQEQMASTVGFREIAGGYSTTRHITNAIRRVIIAKEDTRETLMTYAKTINDEIRVKRREFNLPLD